MKICDGPSWKRDSAMIKFEHACVYQKGAGRVELGLGSILCEINDSWLKAIVLRPVMDSGCQVFGRILLELTNFIKQAKSFFSSTKLIFKGQFEKWQLGTVSRWSHTVWFHVLGRNKKEMRSQLSRQPHSSRLIKKKPRAITGIWGPNTRSVVWGSTPKSKCYKGREPFVNFSSCSSQLGSQHWGKTSKWVNHHLMEPWDQ